MNLGLGFWSRKPQDWVWELTPVFSTLRRQRQENRVKFKTSLAKLLITEGYMMSPCLKT